MDLMRNLSYKRRLFLIVVLFAVVLTALFIGFHHSREKLFKQELLNVHLQTLNRSIADDISTDTPFDEISSRYRARQENLRLTIIDTLGIVLYDSEQAHLKGELGNHLSRSEIAQALKRGSGITPRRYSPSTDRYYFYSALRFENLIIRTALPYDWSLQQTLSVDNRYLWYILPTLLLIVLCGYLVTHRLAENILRLKHFTEKLDSGEDISDIGPFPNDELGDISNHIVDLYSQLQRASEQIAHEQAALFEQEQEKIRIKRQLTNNINHELKTPVSSIRGYIETILSTPNIDKATERKFLEKSLAQTERLQQLLQDVSLITRMDEAPDVIQFEQLMLSDIIKSAVEEWEGHSDNKMKVELNFKDELPISGNYYLLHAIFKNLLDNARAYSGGDKVTITLTKESAEAYQFSFKDNGVGIEAPHLSRIFERFYRLDKGRSRKLGGTGLGLSIVKNSVIFHGGTIEAQNAVGGGLEYIFTLSKFSHQGKKH